MRYILMTITLLIAHVIPSHAKCQGDASNLCLQEQRFQISVIWSDFSGHSGKGTAVSLTPDTGYFWFFSATNVELIVKVLDGHAVNGNFWVFYGALSNVAYTISVKDTSTGQVKQYSNPAGRFASVADTSAFISDSKVNLVAKALNPQPDLSKHDSEAEPSNTCTPDETTLCLNEGRFKVSAFWRDFEGHVGQAHTVFLTGDTGYFWFFSPSNVELVVKALDGRPVNSKLWLFYGALSNVEYVLEVVDTRTGVYKAYHNSSGHLASTADTSAFEDNADAAASSIANYNSYLQTLDSQLNLDLSLSSPETARLFWGLSDPAKTLLSCLRQAAASTTGATCQGLDPQTATYLPATVSSEEARRLGALLAVDGFAAESLFPAASASKDTPKNRSLLLQDTSELDQCSLSALQASILYGTCQVLPPETLISLASLLCIALPGARTTPFCLAVFAVDLSSTILEATQCNTRPIYITRLFVRPEDPIKLGFDDAKNFSVIGNFESRPKAGSAFVLARQTIDHFFSRLGPEALPEQQIIDLIMDAVFKKIGNDIPFPKIQCEAPLSSLLADVQLDVTQGGDVSVDDRTILSGKRESWGHIDPSLRRPLATWPYITGKPGSFKVERKNCSGSGRYRLETYNFPTTGGPAEFEFRQTYTTDACDGSAPSHKILSQPTEFAYPGLPPSYPIFRCDGKWVRYDFEYSDPTCTGVPPEDSCNGIAKTSTIFDNGVLTWRQDSTRNISTPDLVDEFDIFSDKGTYDFTTGDNVLNFSGETRLYTKGGECLSIYDVVRDQFLFHIPAEEPTCRMVDQCP